MRYLTRDESAHRSCGITLIYGHWTFTSELAVSERLLSRHRHDGVGRFGQSKQIEMISHSARNKGKSLALAALAESFTKNRQNTK